MLYNINQQSEPNFFSLICILCAPYIHAQTKGERSGTIKINSCTSDMGFVSQIMDHRPQWLKGLDQILFGVQCDLPSKSALFVGGKVMHRGNFKKGKIQGSVYHTVDGSEIPNNHQGWCIKPNVNKGKTTVPTSTTVCTM